MSWFRDSILLPGGVRARQQFDNLPIVALLSGGQQEEQQSNYEPRSVERARRLRLVAGDLFWKRSGEPEAQPWIGRRGDQLIPEHSVDSRRQLPDTDDFPALGPWRWMLPPPCGRVSNVKM